MKIQQHLVFRGLGGIIHQCSVQPAQADVEHRGGGLQEIVGVSVYLQQRSGGSARVRVIVIVQIRNNYT